VVVRAEGASVYDESGREYVDLFGGCGTAFLGHGDPVVVQALEAQLRKLWITGAIPFRLREESFLAIERFFPSDLRVACLYSTGMEAAEFALRIARVATGRHGFVGFEGCMHGKSLATAHLGWENAGV